jgi:hypothetical protein
MSNSKLIASTILDQIKAGDRMALMAWGTTNLVALPEAMIGDRAQLGGLQMKVRGAKFKGLVQVRLMADDTYTVVMIKPARGAAPAKAMGEIRDVHCEELMGAIDAMIER